MGLCPHKALDLRRLRVGIFWSVSLLLAGPAFAQTAYVTDNLRLGLHRAEDTSDRPFQVLESGQPVEIITRDRLYARVRLPDGIEGWVKAGYLVDDKPAKLVVDQTRAELERVQKELDDTREAFSGSAGRIAELERQLTEQTAGLNEARQEIKALREENDSFRGRMSLYRFSLPWPMVLGAAAVALVLGLVGGMWWIDHRSRRRHGGFRIY